MKHSTFTIIFLGLLLGTGPAAVDSYAPILVFVADDLAVPATSAQLGLSVVLFAMGLGQIIMGPIADRWGRTRPLYAGVLLMIVGSLLSLLAPNIEVLLLGRLLQGLGAATGQILVRAILRDLYSGPALAHATATVTAIMAVVVLMSPPAGYLLAHAFGWRAMFFALLGYGVVLLLFARWKYTETIDKPNPHALRPASMLRAARKIFVHPQSCRFLLVLLIGGFAMFSYVVSSPVVYATSYATTGTKFALLYSSMGVGALIGQLLNRWLINSIGTVPTMIVALGCTAAALALGLLLQLLDLMNAYGFAATLFVFAAGFLMAVSNATALVMDPHGRYAGFAASLVGTLSFVIGSIVGTAIARYAAGDAVIILASMLASVLVCLALTADWLWQARHRHPETVTI